MTDLIEFLTQRIAEDEAVALKAGGDSPRYAEWGYVGEYDSDTSGEVYLPLTKHVETFRTGRTSTHYEYVTSDCEGLRPAVEGHAGPHIARHDPARVLRACAAKRLLISYHDGGVCGFGDNGECLHCDLLGILASEYSDHPDFDERWNQ